MKNRLQSAGRVKQYRMENPAAAGRPRQEVIPGGRHGRYSLSGRGGCTASYAVRKC